MLLLEFPNARMKGILTLMQRVAHLSLQALNEDGCMLGAKIVWMTLMETRSVRRWAACKFALHSRSVW